MRALQDVVIAAALVSVAAFAGLSLAQTTSSHDHHGTPPASKAAKAEMSEGEVRKVDQAGKKITIKHGPLKNLGMPSMTMAFEVTDPAMLDKARVGEKVRFVAANPGGKLTLTEISPAP